MWGRVLGTFSAMYMMSAWSTGSNEQRRSNNTSACASASVSELVQQSCLHPEIAPPPHRVDPPLLMRLNAFPASSDAVAFAFTEPKARTCRETTAFNGMYCGVCVHSASLASVVQRLIRCRISLHVRAEAAALRQPSWTGTGTVICHVRLRDPFWDLRSRHVMSSRAVSPSVYGKKGSRRCLSLTTVVKCPTPEPAAHVEVVPIDRVSRPLISQVRSHVECSRRLSTREGGRHRFWQWGFRRTT